MPKFKLSYFNMPGRAEPVRVAFFLSDVPFEDHRIAYPEFGAMKASGALPLGSVPVLEVDGLVMPQAGAMLRYVAKLGNAGLYPTDPTDAFIVDSTLDCFNDTLSSAMAPTYRENDLEKRIEMRRAVVAGPLTKILAHTEKLIERSGGPFLLGKTMSIADLVIASQVFGMRSGALDGLTGDDLNDFPRINALADAYAADPRIIAYQSR